MIDPGFAPKILTSDANSPWRAQRSRPTFLATSFIGPGSPSPATAQAWFPERGEIRASCHVTALIAGTPGSYGLDVVRFLVVAGRTLWPSTHSPSTSTQSGSAGTPCSFRVS